MFKTIRTGIWLILLIQLLPLAGSPAGAQGLIRKGALKPEDVYNPKPAPGDIILPMPCGLQMVLRPASIPASLERSFKIVFMALALVVGAEAFAAAASAGFRLLSLEPSEGMRDV